MGAGENALFEIFYNLHVCPEGSLAIIDEIELGLHPQAQKRLMNELKHVCLERKLQIICTTHSGSIISEVPSEGRFFIKNYSGGTTVIPGISPYFATGLLAGINSEEITVYVEDDVAKDLLEAILDKDLRSRVLIRQIGSAPAVLSFMAGLRKEGRVEKVLAILDGDKAASHEKNISFFLKKLESYENKDIEMAWIRDRLLVLPGSSWPEKWIMEKLGETLNDDFINLMGVNKSEMRDAIQSAVHAGKHNEYFTLSKEIYQDLYFLRKAISKHVAMNCRSDFSDILKNINKIIN